MVGRWTLHRLVFSFFLGEETTPQNISLPWYINAQALAKASAGLQLPPAAENGVII